MVNIQKAKTLLDLVTLVTRSKTREFAIKVKEIETSFGSEITTADYWAHFYDSQTGQHQFSYQLIQGAKKKENYPTDFENSTKLFGVRETLTGSPEQNLAEKLVENYQSQPRNISERTELRLASRILECMATIEPIIQEKLEIRKKITTVNNQTISIHAAKQAYTQLNEYHQLQETCHQTQS